MATKIILFITLLSYSIIVSQSFMYIISLKQVQLDLKPDPYSELRKLIDKSMRANFKFAVYAALFSNFLLVIATALDPGNLLFITAVIAFIALIADTAITVKGNLPINDIINDWSSGNLPANWAEYRTNWFKFFQYRQVASITGFVSLLFGTVFTNYIS